MTLNETRRENRRAALVLTEYAETETEFVGWLPSLVQIAMAMLILFGMFSLTEVINPSNF